MRREAGEATGTGKSAGAWDAIAALVGMGAVAAVVYADALRSGGARVVGSTDTETYAFLWGFHWGRESLLGDHAWPFRTDLLGFPEGGVLWLKEPLAVLVFAPVLDLVGVAAAYQLTQVFHCLAGGMALYALARRLGASWVPAVVAGLCFGFSPHTLGQAWNGNLEAMNIAWLPLFGLATVEALTRARWRSAPGVGLALFLLCLANQYYALGMALITPPLVLVALWRAHGRPGRAWLRPLGVLLAGLALGLALFAPVGNRILDSLQHPDALTASTQRMVEEVPYHSDLEHLWKPGDPPARALPGKELPFRDPIYVGLGLMLLGALAPLLGPRGNGWRLLWPALGVWMTLLSLGPVVKLDGELVRVDGLPLALPWHYLVDDRPLLDRISMPHRLTPVVGLCWALAAAMTLQGLARRLRGGKVLAAALGAAAFVELLLYPPGTIPLETIPLPRTAHARLLGALEAPGAVINLPVDVPSHRPEHPLRIYWWYQTQHGRPVESRMVGAWPRVLVTSPFLWHELRPLMSDRREVGPAVAPPAPGEVGGAALAAQGFGFVVLHLDLLRDRSPAVLSRWQEPLARNLGEGLVLSDDTVVFALDPAVRAGLPARAREILGPDQVRGASLGFLALLPPEQREGREP